MAASQRTARQSPTENVDEQAGYYVHQRRLKKLATEDPVDMTVPEQVGKRADDYFALCQVDGVKPTIPGLATALGVTPGELAVNPSKTLLMAMQSVLDVTVQMMEDGRIPQAPGIFLLKNWFGYKDANETAIRIQRVSASKEEIREKYANVELVESGDEKRPRRRLGRGK